MATTYNLGQAAIVGRGNYSATASYKQLNTVQHRRGTFMCIADCSNVEPGVTANWQNYWVMTAAGIWDIAVSATDTTVTMNITLSDGSEHPFNYLATAVAANSILNSMIGEAISVQNGGTGASTAAEALENLGITLPLPVTSGGTGATNAETARGNINAQAQAVGYQVSLAGGASSWVKTTDVNGNALSAIKAGSKVFSRADPSSWEAERNYGIRASSQANGSITYVSEAKVPSGITVLFNVVVFN